MNNQSKNSNVSDELLYEFVMDEMEQESELIKGLWAKALAHSEGNDSKAKSLYMQYRVQAIKDQLSALQIDLGDLSKEELFESIKNGFTVIPEKIQILKEQKAEAKEKAIEVAIEEEVKKESEKYGKFGGWLIVFAIFLVIGNLYSFLMVERFFENENLDTLKFLYQNEMDEKASLLNAIAYISFVSYALLLALTISFFRKHYSTKTLAIIYFGSNIVAFPIMIYILIKIDLPTINIMTAIIGGVMQTLFAFVMMRYFMVSERVKKTFVNGSNDDYDILPVIILIISLSAITLASVLYVKESDKNTLMAGEKTANAGAPSSEPFVQASQNEKYADAPKNTSEDVWIDTSTGLMWQDTNQEVKKDWQGAIDYCKDLTYAGYTDWRLPSINTLETLIDDGEKFKGGNDFLWSASITDYDKNLASFLKGSLGVYGNEKRSEYNVRCVRKNK